MLTGLLSLVCLHEAHSSARLLGSSFLLRASFAPHCVDGVLFAKGLLGDERSRYVLSSLCSLVLPLLVCFLSFSCCLRWQQQQDACSLPSRCLDDVPFPLRALLSPCFGWVFFTRLGCPHLIELVCVTSWRVARSCVSCTPHSSPALYLLVFSGHFVCCLLCSAPPCWSEV